VQPTACACCMWGCSLQHVELRPPPQRLQPARLTPSLASTTKRSSGARACDATSGVAGTRSERRCAPSGVSVLKRPSPMERAHARKFLPSGAMTRPKETLPAGAKAQAWRAQGSGGEGSPVAGRSLPLGVPRRLEPPRAALRRRGRMLALPRRGRLTMLRLPPAAVMRFCSSASSGLWSFVSALAVAPAKGGCAPPPEKSTCMGRVRRVRRRVRRVRRVRGVRRVRRAHRTRVSHVRKVQ
jgi:hypothetical protein